ncbi:hypothetical protein S40288_03848 [Stachybotrys chartarum IBT 40288]|nr:hypothetical protein S40288_03848 [Stachybotrys chartarum IBT 40288]
MPHSSADVPTHGKPCTMLRTNGNRIEDSNGQTVVLKGAALGGMLNMENFITGYSGHEHEHRAQMAEVLGEEKSNFFFDRLIHHFFGEADAAYFASLGLNCIRIPFNYRHFIDDMNPSVVKQKGFDLLDRVVDICGKHNLYVVLDMHAVPGGQNQDWHSDSGYARALFWDFKDHQDRAIQLWEALAQHYKGNPVVAGYNLLNEPADPHKTASGHYGQRLIEWYRRAEKSIRAIDPEHMIFIDGNTYAMDFRAFPKDPLPNAVYACHDYSFLGFPIGEQYEGTDEQKSKLRSSFERKVEFMRQKQVPIWNGEFGPVYQNEAKEGLEAVKTNSKRFALLEEQLSIYAETDVSWSIWLYKDIGYQGMTYLDPASPYMTLIQPFVEKKQRLGLDFWGVVNKDGVKHLYEPFLEGLKKEVIEPYRDTKYPKIWTFERQFERVIRECLMSEYVGWEMAELFRGKSKEELEELAGSFAFENCKRRDMLNAILKTLKGRQPTVSPIVPKSPEYVNMPIPKSPNVCAGCRSRKRKCDGTQPACSACVKRGDWCTYPGSSDEAHSIVLTQDHWPMLNLDVNSQENQQYQQLVPSLDPLNFQDITLAASLDQMYPTIPSLPPPSILRDLVNIFFGKHYQTIPIIHYTRLWLRLTGVTDELPRVLVYALCAVSTSYHPDAQVQQSQPQWYEAAKTELSQALHSPSHPIETLQAAVLIIHQAVVQTDYSLSWLLLGDAWRKAVVSGYTQLDGKSSPISRELSEPLGNDPVVKEECRRCIWALYIFDRGLCTIDLDRAIDESRLRIHLPMAEEDFHGAKTSSPQAQPPNMKNLLDPTQQRALQGFATIYQYIILAHHLLGRIGDEVFQGDADIHALHKLKSGLTQTRHILPQTATELSAADPRDHALVIWLNVLLSTCTVMLHHPPGNLENKDWNQCLEAARTVGLLYRGARRGSTMMLDNVHVVPLLFICSRILMIEHAIPSTTTPEDLTVDMDNLIIIFRQFRDTLGKIGQKFYNGFMFYLQQDKDQSQMDKAGSVMELIRPCDHWPFYE